MSDETRLNELLDRWDELRGRGETPTPEDLCRQDPGLVDELRRRIAALGGMDAILQQGLLATETGGAHRTQAGAPPAPALRPAVSPYSTLQFHARGGLGEVFRARDEQLKRDVAIKLIQASRAGSAEGRLRFEREAEVTGRLEHPGIAPVHAAGQCEDGRPYYVMRFIGGETLGDAIRRYHRADTPTQNSGEKTIAFRDLLNRFVQVCNTIDYAHGRRVLHRDIKPSNVMLGPHGETLVVDWGLAKLYGNGNQERDHATPAEPVSPNLTATGSALGTPAFMAPEQLDGATGRLGPATDVYSLGATLYALLTGHAPSEGGDLASIQDRVRRGDFPRPREIHRAVPRALEAVCLKAMSLKPEDRYDSARILAHEIERWLADEPVTAWREPWKVRLVRWARRHRPRVVAATASLAALTLMLGVSTILLTRANERTRTQQRIAQQNLDESRRVVSDMFEKIIPRLPDLKGMDEVEREILERGLTFYSGFVLTRSQSPAARYEFGRAYLQVGVIQDRLNQTQAAEQSLQEGKATLESLVTEHPTESSYQETLASILDRLGQLYIRTNRPAEAEHVMGRALALDAELARRNPGDVKARSNLARSSYGLGRYYDHNARLDEAETAYQRAVAIQEALVSDHPEEAEYRSRLARSLYELGWVLDRRGRAEEALRMYERQVDLQEKLVADYPLNSAYKSRLTDSLSYLGALYGRRGRMTEAERAHQRAISIQEELVEAHPGVFQHLDRLAGHFLNLGNHYRRVARPAQAEQLHRKALRIFEQGVRAHPDQILYQTYLGNCLNNIGTDAEQRGAYEDALQWLDRGIHTLESVLRTTPRHGYTRNYLSFGYRSRAAIHYQLGGYQQAIADLQQAADVDEGNSHDAIRSLRALVLGRMGERARALAEIAEVAEKSNDGGALGYAAALHAFLSAHPASDAEDHADQAMSLLVRARATGLFELPVNLKALLHDRDYDPLRSRQDFQALLADLTFPTDPFAP
jgi:serine/threonine-protein kinase